ncbi:zinc finger and BTB domain-containing protein 12 [Protopterus annectens]|uniref:zinc finger and BTB domain-containing protein 12 n=1 Tax=Protopterus annectens TaxID=7888 RepID=UPI001CFAEA07|nr:zinc finger and BTB domain-containing protein 12 [Protopterus annectens]XP_043912176.1 zinc finger and BTB domain-containing protein 12 [Protopterus annectens]
MMACEVDMLRFQLPGHEAATLKNMNQLRSEERFCDITIVMDNLKFRGHKVIFAACSPFLRDQFLLNPNSELQVSLMHNPKIVTDLLLSCYTGVLEFAIRDIVNYLTAASYLQMEHVVEKCRNALFQFIEPKITLKDEVRGKGNFFSKRQKSYSSKPTCSKSVQVSTNSEGLQPQCEMQQDSEIKAEAPEEEEYEDVDDDDDSYDEEEDAMSDVCVIKVEESTENRSPKPPLICNNKPVVAEPDESGVNSTMEGGGFEDERQKENQAGVVKAFYSLCEDGEGDGLVVIPAQDENEEAVGIEECQSSSMVNTSDICSGIPIQTPNEAGVANYNVKNIKCTKCDEFFQGIEKLVFHMRAQHFICMCPRCGKQFNNSSNLNRHMNVHRGIKSHSCTICGKSFTQKSTLHDHMNLHSGERPYRCSYCNVRFAHKPAIRRHLKEQHGKTTAENFMDANVAEISVVVR